MKKKLGIIGGLGPGATAYFLELLTVLNDVDEDQKHIETIIYSKPGIPDRTKYILNKSNENPVPIMNEVGRMLKDNGADIIAIPCITAHYFHEELEEQIGLPIIHAIKEACVYMQDNQIDKVGILATDGTVSAGLLQDMMDEYHIQYFMPDEGAQKEIMQIIYNDVKAGRPVDINKFEKVSDELFKKGADKILLACTELSLIKKDYKIGEDYLDILEILAKASLEKSGYVCKKI